MCGGEGRSKQGRWITLPASLDVRYMKSSGEDLYDLDNSMEQLPFYTREGFVKLGFYLGSFLVYLYRYVRSSLSLSHVIIFHFSFAQCDQHLVMVLTWKPGSPDKVSDDLSLL